MQAWKISGEMLPDDFWHSTAVLTNQSGPPLITPIAIALAICLAAASVQRRALDFLGTFVQNASCCMNFRYSLCDMSLIFTSSSGVM